LTSIVLFHKSACSIGTILLLLIYCWCLYQLKKVAHGGAINRIRSMTQESHICATWGDTGHVQVLYFGPNFLLFTHSWLAYSTL
jgi:hypothetical protein